MKDLKTKDIALVGLFAGLTVVCAWISIPLGPVPVTLQTFAVFLGAALLGSKRGTLAVAVYILLGVVGLPVFSGFKSLNPLTFGYVLGFLPLGMLTAAADKRLVLLRHALSGHGVRLREDPEPVRDPLRRAGPNQAGPRLLPGPKAGEICKIKPFFILLQRFGRIWGV